MNIKKIFFLILILLGMGLLHVNRVAYAQTGGVSLSLTPASVPLPALNSPFSLNFQMNPNSYHVSAIDTIITFNSSQFSANSVTLGTVLPNQFITNGYTIDNTAGTIHFILGSPTDTFVTGTTFSTIATISFTAKNSGTISISNNSQVASTESTSSVTGTLTGSIITIVPSATPVPPTLTPTRTPTPVPPTPTRTPTPTTGGLTPTPASCSTKSRGDADCNGVIDGIDYSRWLNSQCVPGALQTCASYDADFNGDGRIDDTDLGIWQANKV